MTIEGPGGVTMSADWVPAEGAEHEGSWLVSGDDAVHALLDDALRALGAPVGDGVAGGRLHGPVRSSDRLGDVHASLGELDRRVDSVYGQAVREAHAEIVSVSNAYLEPVRSDLELATPASLEAAIGGWEPGDPFPYHVNLVEPMSPSASELAREHAVARNAPREREDSD